MTVRKNFNFDEETAKHLEELAKAEGKTQTEITQEAIEKVYKEKARERKLQALQKLKQTPAAHIGDIDIRQARIQKALRHG